jgi:DNA-binding LacI/PurR family transcriptional regulator
VRVAKKANVDPSYVSRVISGKRNSPKIVAALKAEIKRLEKLRP